MWKILSAPPAGIKLPSRDCEAHLCVRRYFTLAHVRGHGSEEPKSPQETRQVLDQHSRTVDICQVHEKQSTAFEFCRSKVPEQTCSRTGERTHECVSEFVSLAHAPGGKAVIRGEESDAVQRLERYPAEDVEMDPTGTAIPDGEFHEEPHHEAAQIPEEVPNAIRLVIMRVHKKTWHPRKELLCHALRIGGANKMAINAASERKCAVCSENKPPESQLPVKLADTYTEFNQGVGEDLLMLADSDEHAFEFQKIVDLATRFNICFPVPSKRPDDILSVLEMVRRNWAIPMNHLISDMGDEFEGELGLATSAVGRCSS